MTTILKKETPNEQFGTSPEPNALRLERLMPGPIERIWSYLTESDKRAQWFASGPMELKVGGLVKLSFDNNRLTPHGETTPEEFKEKDCGGGAGGRITVCDPPHRLSFTWGLEAGASEVTFELSPRGENVLLVLTHRRLANRDMMLNVAAGWHTHVAIWIDKLEGRVPAPFWPAHARRMGEYAERI